MDYFKRNIHQNKYYIKKYFIDKMNKVVEYETTTGSGNVSI